MPEPVAAFPPAEETALPPAAEAAEGYQVRLDVFEGPLDLLLFLIRKEKIDIHVRKDRMLKRKSLLYFRRMKFF